jgi:short-subunit dehydrogenase
MATQWKVAWITGASSGIGRELALRLARSGVTVAASARSMETLAELSALEPRIKPYPLDVTDKAAVARTFAAIESEVGPVDLAILNAGVWHVMSSNGYDIAKIEQSMAVNYFGVVYALDGLMRAMKARRSGHIAMVASVAGYVGLPRAIAYGPSKSAVITLAQSLKTDLERDGIDVTVINPGFVDTPMTRVNTFPMPFIIPVEDAASRIVAGLERRQFEIAFPRRMALLLALARRAPYPVLFGFLRNLVYRRGQGD